jgi:glycosyltransferase involved in cell wall biosynthesis
VPDDLRPTTRPGPGDRTANTATDELLRVLFVVPRLGIGGAERHAATLMTRLDPHRFAPSLVSIGLGGRNFDEVRAAGLPARALGRTRWGLPLSLMQLIAHMRRTRPDVVVLRGANAEVLGRIAAAVAGVPRTVVWVHNCGDITPRPRTRRLADRVLEPVTSAYYGVAYGQQPYLTDELHYPEHKITIIQNGVDPAVLRAQVPADGDEALAAELGIPVGAPVVGIVGVLRPEKDHGTFLRAARLVLDRRPETRFLVVGSGVMGEELHRVAAELGVADRVIFTGARDDVPALLRLMRVFTMTSSTVECFPMALLEAMAMGRPAVCTAVGGVPEMIEEGVTGHLVPRRDPAAVADRLVALLDDPERAAAMGRAARERLEANFTLDRSVARAETALVETAHGVAGRV